jgi:phosphatidate cytidylyltransferase
MIIQLYYTILGLFVLGAILMAVIHHRRPGIDRRNNWIKYTTYFFIINAIIGTVVFLPGYFIWLVILILVFAGFEILKLMYGTEKKAVFLVAVPVFAVLSFTFIRFSQLPWEWMFMTVFVVNIFDAFSQLSGQLLGRTPILPRISPNKTAEGTVGGLIFAILAAWYVGVAIGVPLKTSIATGIALAAFAFTGDLLASLLKRKAGVKDFSRLLPGQGGFLDRFDSLLFSSLLMYILNLTDWI